MTLSLEAESLAQEALKAAEDARKAQQRLQMLKKRYGMMKKDAKSSSTIDTTPTKPTVETAKTVIAPTTKTVVEVHKQDHHHEESSTDPTVETRGTGSFTTNEKTIEDALTSFGPPPPPPPPPPKVIRAVSPRNEPPPEEPAAVDTRDEGAMPETKTETVQERQEEKEAKPEGHRQTFSNVEKLLAEAQQDIASELAPPVQTTEQKAAELPKQEVLQDTDTQVYEETQVEAPNEETPQVTPVVEAPKECEFKPVVESEPEPTPQPVVEKHENQGQIFSFHEATTSLPVVQEGSEGSKEEAEQLPVQSAPVQVAPVQTTPVEPTAVQPTPVEPATVQPTPVEGPTPWPTRISSEMPSVEQKKEDPQDGHQVMPPAEPNQQAAQPVGQRRGASPGGIAESYRLPKPAYLEAEAMMGAMLHDRRPLSPRERHYQQHQHHHHHFAVRQQPAGKAMPEMAVPASSASHYYSVPGTLHPIDELQQRVAAIPETHDDVPAPHYQHDQYGASYHYGDDVSVLTDLNSQYPKPLSPRNVNREPINEEPRGFQEPPETRRPTMEERSQYGDAPARDACLESHQSHQSQQARNFAQAETPRFRNNSNLPISPRSDPVGQLEPDQKDPRQPEIQDPPQINSRQFDHEAGRGMEPNEVRMQPLVSHLRARAEPEGKGRNPPRPSRRVQLSIDPNSPRNQMEDPISPLSQSTARHHHPQYRAAPVGYTTPYGGYASGAPVVSNTPQQQVQHRYITTRSGAATVASYHRAHYPGDATIMSQPLMRQGSPMYNGSPVNFRSSGSVSSMPRQRTEFFGNNSFHEQRHFVPSGGASVAPSTGGETIISVRTNARGNKVVKKLIKVEEEGETDPVVAFCDFISIDKVCGIEFDEQYKVVEEELPPEPLTAADVGRNTAMGKKVFNENNYTDPFAGRHNEAGLCGLL